MLELEPGRYTYEVERGPEWSCAAGHFVVTDESKLQRVAISIRRIVDLSEEGWWSGDLHFHRSLDDIDLLLDAEDLDVEDLDVGPVITWWNKSNPWAEQGLPEDPLRVTGSGRRVHVMGGEDERGGGALLYFNLDRPSPIMGAGNESPSPMKFLRLARERHNDRLHVDVEKPFWWDTPAWVASGMVDTLGTANNHMCRNLAIAHEAWGKPRDAERLPSPLGNGEWSQEIYYKLLDCGLRLPPSAGSASGVLRNPVGYNRVFVHLDGALDYDAWWRGLKVGRSFVTNGRLLRVPRAGSPVRCSAPKMAIR